jgi:pimeloyl-ACP methyl ester carboxylesterase
MLMRERHNNTLTITLISILMSFHVRNYCRAFSISVRTTSSISVPSNNHLKKISIVSRPFSSAATICTGNQNSIHNYNNYRNVGLNVKASSYSSSTRINSRNNQIETELPSVSNTDTDTDTLIRRNHPTMKCTEVILQCSDKIQLACKKWSIDNTNNNNNNTNTNQPPRRKILLLHGWLDNSASFNIMGPILSSQLNADVVALDFPGHGHSSHKSPDGPTQSSSEYVLYVVEALNSLQWMGNGNDTDTSGVTIIGHSMGSNVAVLFAAVYPDYVNHLVLLEHIRLRTSPAANTARDIRNAVHKRMRSNRTLYSDMPKSKPNDDDENPIGTATSTSPAGNNSNININRSSVINRHRGKKRYANLNTAIEARIKTATLSPGEQYISQEAATELVSRATVRADKVFDPNCAGGEELFPSTYDGPVYFRHDPRLMRPNFNYFTDEQEKALLRDIQSPTCLLMAEDGWPIEEYKLLIEESLSILQPAVHERLPGSHHFHADPLHATAVCNAVINFINPK